MNTCHRIQDNLVSFLGGELAGGETEWIKTHLEICPACRREYAQLEQIPIRSKNASTMDKAEDHR